MAGHAETRARTEDSGRHARQGSTVLPRQRGVVSGEPGQHARPTGRTRHGGARVRRSSHGARPLRFLPLFVATLVVGAVVVALALTVATPPNPQDGTAARGPSRDDAGASPADDTAGSAPVDLPPVTPATEPGDARIQVEQLLAHRTLLESRRVRAGAREDTGAARSSEAALRANADDLTRVLVHWTGPDAAVNLRTAFSAASSSLAAYAATVASGDVQRAGPARAAAVHDGEHLIAELSDTVADEAARESLGALLKQRLTLALEQVDAYGDDDYARAFAVGRTSYAHASEAGTLLAVAVVAARTPVPADFGSPERELESRLGMLLAEHAELTVDVTATGLSGSPDFPAAAAALDANRGDLAAVVAGVLGTEAGAAFVQVWADQTDAVVAYARALAGDDQGAQQRALDRMAAVAATAAAFFEAHTAGALPAAEVSAVLAQHHAALAGHAVSLHARDLARTVEMSTAAYRGAVDLAAVSAPAIAASVAARAPEGGVQTGLGALADVVGGR